MVNLASFHSFCIARAWCIAVTCIAVLTIVGCSRAPVVEAPNLKLVSSLRTACSARNPDWLEGVQKAVDDRLAKGQMSEAAHRHFVSLIDQARAGEWEQAERACLDFERAQLSRPRQ